MSNKILGVVLVVPNGSYFAVMTIHFVLFGMLIEGFS
uniref:Uncharacterized protein n=1 Tax=Lepeophtheirus salmonis TaxID=72036 RepID=A0A0K2TIT7_LEPSM